MSRKSPKRNLLINRMPLTYRWIIGSLLFISFFVVLLVSYDGGYESAISPLVAGGITLALIVVVSRAKVYMHDLDGEVQIGQFPFFRKNIPYSSVSDLEIIHIPIRERIDREWGIRGHFSGEGGLFLDCGSSSLALRIYLKDGRYFDLGCGHDSEAGDRILRESREILLENS